MNYNFAFDMIAAAHYTYNFNREMLADLLCRAWMDQQYIWVEKVIAETEMSIHDIVLVVRKIISCDSSLLCYNDMVQYFVDNFHLSLAAVEEPFLISRQDAPP